MVHQRLRALLKKVAGNYNLFLIVVIYFIKLSSSSNPKSNRHRLAAKTASILNRLPLISVDDRSVLEKNYDNDLTCQLSLVFYCKILKFYLNLFRIL